MKSLPLCLAFVAASLSPALNAETPAPPKAVASPGVVKGDADEALSVPLIEGAIHRAMEYLRGKEKTGGLQYSDYVVFCGRSVVETYPEHKGILESYQKWITENDRYNEKFPYQSACHVMALDIIGEHDKAVEIFTQLIPTANEGRWGTSYHLGWYLYGCIVADQKDLLEDTFGYLNEHVLKRPHKHQYFIAYCLWKAFEKTKDDRYQSAFVTLADSLKPLKQDFFEEIAKDGHGGMVLSVFCRAYQLSKDPEHREIAEGLAKILLASQEENGSWNKSTAYTIMPVEGLADYLKFCR